jgi:hypothetical protein
LLESECLGPGDSDDNTLWSTAESLEGKFEGEARPKRSQIAALFAPETAILALRF